MRRAVAGAALLVVLILIVVGIHSCTVGSTSSALRSYNDSVASLVRASNQTGQQFFALMPGGTTKSTNPTTLQSEVEATRVDAARELQRAEGLSAPSGLTLAQQGLVWTMRMRRDGIADVASRLQSALQPKTGANAVLGIAVDMANLYASDALYKNYTLPLIESALRNAGIAVGPPNGQPVETGQFVPSISWVDPTFVAGKFNTILPTSTSNKPAAPGVHGHALDSCSVGSTTLDTTVATNLPAGTAPTLTCAVTNDGQNTETNVIVRASIAGTSVTGQGTIPQTQSGQQYNVQIPLSAAPPNGTYQLKVTVEPVPGEHTFTHNTKIFPVTFG